MNNNLHFIPKPAAQTGTTLLEVLIAIVIISFGLLGIASMQITGLKNNQSSFYRTTATVLAYDMLDRMRVNRKSMIAGDYDTGGAYKNSTSDLAASPSSMKDKDKNDWLTSLGKRLPSGAGKIQAAAGAATVKVWIRWDDQRGTNGSTAQEFFVEVNGCPTGDTCNF